MNFFLTMKFVFFFLFTQSFVVCDAFADNTYHKFRDIILLDSSNETNLVNQQPLIKYLGRTCFDELQDFYKTKKFGITLETISVRDFRGPYGKDQKSGLTPYFYHYTFLPKDQTEEYKSEYPALIDDLQVKYAKRQDAASKMRGIYFDMRTWANNTSFGANIFGFESDVPQNDPQFSNTSGGMIYLASNPYSATSYGNQLVTFEFEDTAKIYVLQSQENLQEKINNKKSVWSAALSHCPVYKLTHIVLDELDVDLVYYTASDFWDELGNIGLKDSGSIVSRNISDHPKKFLGWFQLLGVNKIKSIRILYMIKNKNTYREVNAILRKNNRGSEILRPN